MCQVCAHLRTMAFALPLPGMLSPHLSTTGSFSCVRSLYKCHFFSVALTLRTTSPCLSFLQCPYCFLMLYFFAHLSIFCLYNQNLSFMRAEIFFLSCSPLCPKAQVSNKRVLMLNNVCKENEARSAPSKLTKPLSPAHPALSLALSFYLFMGWLLSLSTFLSSSSRCLPRLFLDSFACPTESLKHLILSDFKVRVSFSSLGICLSAWAFFSLMRVEGGSTQSQWRRYRWEKVLEE